MRATLAAVLLAAIAFAAGACSKVTGLPPVPADVTAEEAGMEELARSVEEARLLAAGPGDAAAAGPLGRAREALARIEDGDAEEGLRMLGEALEADASSLVLANAYRMSVYRLKHEFRARSRERGERAATLTGYLDGEPLTTLERIATKAPGRAIELQIALAYVDRMVLNPALEIKAPASIDSVEVLSGILQGRDRHYVPALFARGLNYLHRPRNLEWPEEPKPPRDAGSRDLSLAVAVAAKLGDAPPRLRAHLLTTLGDAYAHEERVDVARSWWLLARETSPDPTTLSEIATRMGWTDEETPDRLESHLEARFADQGRPYGDLSFLWNAGEESDS